MVKFILKLLMVSWMTGTLSILNLIIYRNFANSEKLLAGAIGKMTLIFGVSCLLYAFIFIYLFYYYL